MLHKPIYAICDFELLKAKNISFEAYINLINKYNIVYIQYRDKINSTLVQFSNIIKLKNLTNIPIVANDKLRLLDVADGLHLGQEDLNTYSISKNTNEKTFFSLLKKKYPLKIFGLSTHNELEILLANSLPLDYIGLGAYRETKTKDVSSILGDSISLLAKKSIHKVAIIGGVRINDNLNNISYNAIGSGLFRD